ncbi:MAG: SMI1/KNR4 family protein [Lachnospiraceae bacterium]|nr:SMI1/KNR4 family protein [Lachnospiraceae bacterium]
MEQIKVELPSIDGFTSTGAVEEFLITEAEEELGIVLADDYRECLSLYGAVSGNGHELTGICNTSRLNVVEVTKEERELRNDIPVEWYVIEQLHIDGVVIWQSCDQSIYQAVPGHEPEKIHDDLFSYISAK